MSSNNFYKAFIISLLLILATNKIDAQTIADYKSKLSLRIYPDEALVQKGGVDSLVFTVDLPGTKTLLMLDLPNIFVPVQRKEFDKWGITARDAFQMAHENVAKRKIENITKVFDVDGAKVEFNFLGNEDYAASYALNIGANKPELVGEWGSVVVIPNRGLVVICKISRDKPLDFVKFIQRIKPLTDRSYIGHQSPVSKHFFWYYKGTFTTITVNETTNGGINVVAPPELGELMSVKK